MILKAEQDIYGNVEQFTTGQFRHILDLIDDYMGDVPYTIREIRQDDINDTHERIDIEVRFRDENDYLIQQKLLILDDELIDGKTFHERYQEWYE